MGSVRAIQYAELCDAPAQIPPGEYQATYMRHETAYFAKSPKVYVWFRIIGGSHDGTKIYRAYRVEALNGKPRKGGAFKVRHSSELYRQFVTATGHKERPDRIALSRLRNCVLLVSVRTVMSDYRQRPLSEALQYSVVDEIKSVEAGKC